MCTNGSQPSYVECVVGKWNTNQYYARGNAARLLLKVKDMVIYYRGAGDVSYGRAWHSSSITPTTVQSVPADATDITIE